VRRDPALFAVTTNLPRLSLRTINGYQERFRETDDHHIHQGSKTASGWWFRRSTSGIAESRHDGAESRMLWIAFNVSYTRGRPRHSHERDPQRVKYPSVRPRIVAVTDGGAAGSLGRPTSKGAARGCWRTANFR